MVNYAEGRLEIARMKKIDKPWGHEIIWAEGDTYIGKIIYINAGHKLSRQYHQEKEETILVKAGVLYLEDCGYYPDIKPPSILKLLPGESFHVLPGRIHRFIADETNVELIEVSSVELEDVVRLEDDYCRATD